VSSLNFYDVIKKPVITEKANDVNSFNKYCFVVDSSANKAIIKASVEKIFNVKVSGVNIVNKKRTETFFKGRKGFNSSCKKAIVTLMSGFTIDLMSEVK
jgi:large subunit ribosomal protein L23